MESTTAIIGYDEVKEVGNSIISNDDYPGSNEDGENASLRFHCISSSGQKPTFYITRVRY